MTDIFKKLTVLDNLTEEQILHSIRFSGDESWEIQGMIQDGSKFLVQRKMGVGVQAAREYMEELKLEYKESEPENYGATFGMGY